MSNRCEYGIDIRAKNGLNKGVDPVQEPMILVTRLEELSDNAATASVYERAAIYSATKEIERQLIASSLCKNPAVRKLVQKACFYLCAAIEYEFLEDEPAANCIELAGEALDSLRSKMTDYNY